jgi:hypothetical protein
LDRLAASAVRIDEELQPPGIYFTPNPVNPTLLARAKNRAEKYVKHTTTDADIMARSRFFVDVDSIRPAGISATDEEHEVALERTKEIRAFLIGCGWPPPASADSGNGGGLVYAIALPNDDGATTLCRRMSESLDALFSDSLAVVDRTTFNAARIWKVYGTVARKGDDIPDCPHRLSRIIEAPPALIPVSREQLEQIAALLEEPTADNAYQSAAVRALVSTISSSGICPGASNVSSPTKVGDASFLIAVYSIRIIAAPRLRLSRAPKES